MRITSALISTVALCFTIGCGADLNGNGFDLAGGGGGDGGAPTGDGGGGGFDRDAACAQVSADGTLVKKPVDIIFVIDNSGSMTGEIQAVENNVNVNFAQIIGASGLDYRVIMVSTHGSASGSQSICIGAPLSGNTTCSPPPATPTNGARFFHYSTEIGSNNSLQKIRDTYNVADPNGKAPGGWSDWLRADAVKVFVEITDDDATNMTADQFETMLFAKVPAHFGTAAARNYIWHSIAGFNENNPVTKPWAPTDPIQTAECNNGNGSEGIGQVYQELSQRTGGLRFPICQFANFDAVFQEIAKGVVQGAQVACEFEVPAPPPGQTVDLNTVLVDYYPSGGGQMVTFQQVANAAACMPNSFYIENGKIILCPDTCTQVKGDVMAKVKVLFDCTVPLG
jgi:hypothetical protein